MTARVRILNGGSVKPANAVGIFALADVDGGLIGGASLKAGDFWGLLAPHSRMTASLTRALRALWVYRTQPW